MLLVAGLSFAEGKKHKLSRDLEALKGGHNGATMDVIIQFNQTPTTAHHQKVQGKGGVLKTNLDFIKGAHHSVPVEALDALADDPEVVHISPDRPVSGSLDYVTSAVGAPTAWNNYGLDGTGIGVAIIDSGIPDLNDFKDAGGKARIVYSNSAGTYGYGTIAAPGNDSYAITVGALKTNRTYSAVDDTIATYSLKGPTGYDHVLCLGDGGLGDENPLEVRESAQARASAIQRGCLTV